MFNKFPAIFIVALTITAEAAHAKHQHIRRHYGPGYNALNSSVTSVAPLSSTSASSLPIPLSSVPSGTGLNSIPLPSVSVPLSTAPSAITALPSSSKKNTVSTKVKHSYSSYAPSDYRVPVPHSPPYPTAVNSGSTGQGPIGTAPLGTKPKESSKPAKPETPGKVNNETPEASGKVGNEVPGSSGKVGSESPKASDQVETSAKVTVVTSASAFVTTIGTGSQTTVLTTTIKRTSTRTLFRTIYATAPSSSATEKGVAGVSSGTPEEPTTTIVSTITSTRVVILQPLPTGEASNAGKGSGEGETPKGETAKGETPKGGAASEGGNNRVVSENSCPSPVTVTVTKAPVTVTVTANPPPAKASSAEEAPKPSAVEEAAKSSPVGEVPKSSAVEEAPKPSAVEEAPKSSPVKELPSSTTPAVVKSSAVEEAVSSSAVPSFSSVPFNNGTNAVTSRTPPVYPSSGFLTRTSASFTLRPTASAVYYR